MSKIHADLAMAFLEGDSVPVGVEITPIISKKISIVETVGMIEVSRPQETPYLVIYHIVTPLKSMGEDAETTIRVTSTTPMS